MESETPHPFFVIDSRNFPPPLAYPESAEPTARSEPIQDPTFAPPCIIPSNFQPISSQSQLESLPIPPPPQQQQPIVTNPLSNLGKDGDVYAVKKELTRLLELVDHLLTETDIVFTSIEQMYTADPSPVASLERLENLIKGYSTLAQDFRISGFGGIPIPDDDRPYNLHTLLQMKQLEVQELYLQRQARRQGSTIVMGVLQASNTASNPDQALTIVSTETETV